MRSLLAILLVIPKGIAEELNLRGRARLVPDPWPLPMPPTRTRSVPRWLRWAPWLVDGKPGDPVATGAEKAHVEEARFPVRLEQLPARAHGKRLGPFFGNYAAHVVPPGRNAG